MQTAKIRGNKKELMLPNYLLSTSGLFLRRKSKEGLPNRIHIIILGEPFHYLSCALNCECVLPFHKVILSYHRCIFDENELTKRA